jgi:hypothetical protein
MIQTEVIFWDGYFEVDFWDGDDFPYPEVYDESQIVPRKFKLGIYL